MEPEVTPKPNGAELAALPVAVPSKPTPPAADGPKRVKMDDSLIGILADIRGQLAALQARREGAVILFLRQQKLDKLEGSWGEDPNGRDLVRNV